MKKAQKNREDASLPEAKELTPAEGPQPSVEKVKNDNDQSDLPIDRGYAWVIVFGCLVSNIVCLGLQRAYGILFVEFVHMLELPVGVVSLVLSIQSAVVSVSGLLTQTVMLSLLSERQTMMIGAIVGGTGMICSSFATSLVHLIFTHSLLVGAANGMLMGPTMVIVGKYFHKRRSFAIALSTLGGNLGSMTMPPLTEALLEEFGLFGTLLMLGGFFLNILVFVSLLRPLVPRRRRCPRKRADEPHLIEEDQPSVLQDERHRGNACRRWSAGGRLLHPNMDKNPRLCISSPELFIATEALVTYLTDDNEDSDNDSEQQYELHPLQKKHGASTNGNNVCSGTRPDAKCNREPCRKKRGLCSKILAMFDFNLFKQPSFLLAMCVSAFGTVPAALYGMYLPALAADYGVTGQRAASLLTVFGGCGIASRLAFGYLADMNLIRRSHLLSLLLFVPCTAGLFISFYTSFTLLLFFSVIYGLFCIVYFSMLPVVMVDLMGLDKLPKVIGFGGLFQGVLAAASHLLIGSLRDMTGNYHASYYYISASGLLCAGFLLLSPLVMRQKNNSMDHSRVVSTPDR